MRQKLHSARATKATEAQPSALSGAVSANRSVRRNCANGRTCQALGAPFPCGSGPEAPASVGGPSFHAA